jgi:formylglycine-generating enzyme required for sulfatase activity
MTSGSVASFVSLFSVTARGRSSKIAAVCSLFEFMKTPVAALVLGLLATAYALPAGAADPAYYVKKSTWQETMLASLEAIAQSDLEDGFAPFESETRRGGDAAQRVSVPVAGARVLYLFVTGCPDVRWGVADWAEATLLQADGRRVSLTQGDRFKALLGRCEQDMTLRSGLYQKLRVGERTFDRGLNVQANSMILVPLDKTSQRLEAWIGVDAWAGTNGAVRFSVVGPRTAARKRLFELAARDFPEGQTRQQMAWVREDRIFEFDWKPGDWAGLAQRFARVSHRVPALATKAMKMAEAVSDRPGWEQVRDVYFTSRVMGSALDRARAFEFEGLRLALADLEQAFPQSYPKRFRQRAAELESGLREALARLPDGALTDYERAADLQSELEALKSEALLANPLLNFDRLLVIKRVPNGDPRRSQWEGFGLGEFIGLPRQSSWANGTMPNVDRWTNEIAVVSPVRPAGQIRTLFKPEASRLVSDLDLHWSTDKLLFSMPDPKRNWQVFELRLDGKNPPTPIPGPAQGSPTIGPQTSVRQLTGLQPDVHNYSAIYLPDGYIDFVSTAPLQGVPCNASVIVGMMYQMDADGYNIRQICFEQDHDYTPSILNNGRVLYLRWDYTDTPHVWNRLLMSMNPDGTGQMEYYGASSYWPNAIFFARAIPNHPTKVVGIVTGHHEGRVGELVIFDPAKGRHETNGVVQRLPGRGQPIEPKIEDKLTEHSWPKFLHPWPLSENYFLVACKPGPDSLWGIYLVDVFDNMVLVKEEEHFALLQPIPLAKRTPPPVLDRKVVSSRKDAMVYMEDVYHSPGMRGVPRGTVKELRVFTYQFGFQTLAGIDHRVGADGPWEAKRVLGTVPVQPDGSALFYVPAKTPVSFQPLDTEGKAMGLMRSWITGMPGEFFSCTGCHDRQSTAPPGLSRGRALNRPVSDLKPWHGPVHGFNFAQDLQTVLDQHCVRCHNGEPRPDGKKIPDLRGDQGGYFVYRAGQLDGQFIRAASKQELLGKYGAVFEPSYVALRQYVRVGGLESDLHLLPPMEFHADTSELIQMLRKGHQDVQLDAEAWDRLVTWIDLNAPCHGRWADVTKLPGNQRQRRVELRTLYGGVVEDCEEEPTSRSPALRRQDGQNPALRRPDAPSPPAPSESSRGGNGILPGAGTQRTGTIGGAATATAAPPKGGTLAGAGWPFDAAEARRRQAATGVTTRTVDLGGGIRMELVRIPEGSFVMGDSNGEADERPEAVVKIRKAFWMAKVEVSNEQFSRFDALHDSRFEHRTSWIFSEEYLGWPLNQPSQPAVRVSWDEAMSFCRWLSARLNEKVSLPTEAQWEYACRAGTATPLWYGDTDAEFARFGNMGDRSLRRLADEGWRPKAPDLVPKDSRFDDGALVTVATGRYAPNPWGLCDMHGNAAEWTRSTYQPYPYNPEGGREEANATPALRSAGSGGTPDVQWGGRKVVRGGSWRDRPKNCRSSFRLAYQPWQQVFNVGFRVVIEEEEKTTAAVSSAARGR